ncbi:alpha/beta hydrolase [Glutamicibacter sp. MNS18]|uniref:alpha/beta hydrolase n=1 Tax=Glutamicibacter sp. MNS18 TaxID=2989817 RepID=UPI002235CE81|nr:alpha/beta hydrolase [Glutamicibacter sp. MNS18]MCW4465860.1 alpha/beta hydrolase [Glutamicibacter sp. MNS18]
MAARNKDEDLWGADVLGADFQCRVIDLPDGARATLVRHRPPGFRWRPPGALRGHAVLYVHGWSDYFFQHELAEFLTAAGADFYALDLRNYGRNLGPGSVPGFITSLEDYFDEFDAARRIIRQAHPRHRLVLLGHSTGGLSACLYAAARPQAVDALVLNSPWLEFQAAEFGRAAISALFATGSRINPLRELPRIDPGFYTRTVSSAYDGEWDYDLSWRPAQGFRVTTGFVNAVFRAQAKVAKGLGLDIPVLVLLSSRDYLLPRWNPDARRADVALNVEVVARRSTDVTSNLGLLRLDGALHDVFLSPPAVRQRAYVAMGSWIDSHRHRPSESRLRKLAGKLTARAAARHAPADPAPLED